MKYYVQEKWWDCELWKDDYEDLEFDSIDKVLEYINKEVSNNNTTHTEKSFTVIKGEKIDLEVEEVKVITKVKVKE